MRHNYIYGHLISENSCFWCAETQKVPQVVRLSKTMRQTIGLWSSYMAEYLFFENVIYFYKIFAAHFTGNHREIGGAAPV